MEQLQFKRCEVKSKYFSEWQIRTITIHPCKNTLGISHHGAHLYKYFKLNQINVQQKSPQILNIQPTTGRVYEVKGPNIPDILEALRSHQILTELGEHCEVNTICRPKSIDYSRFIQNLPLTSPKIRQIPVGKLEEPEKQYPRQKSYYKEEDWAINKEDGGLILISEEKKKNQGKIIKFVLKKFISTGGFMGISFPVFAMKPQSILETYCKSVAAAPIIFASYNRCPFERMKQFVCFCFTFSRLFTDMDKPFNPTLGQTFQAQIAGGTYSAEQTSHHPPQSSIHFQGKGYKIHATLELVAQIGINSASGMIQGDIVIQFQQGGKIIGRSLKGDMTGFIFGENRFRPDGSCYSYDPQNNIVCSYKRVEKDIFRGYLGKLKENSDITFQKLLKTKQRFTDFSSFEKSHFSQIESKIQACWSEHVKFNENAYIDFNDNKWLPYQPNSEKIRLLASDSRYRTDIQLRKNAKFDESQEEKQRLEEEQRILRKLRSIYVRKNQDKKT